MLREVAEGIAKFIEEDQVLHDDGHVTVVVEDKANVAAELEIALGQLGVCVLIAVTGFDRKPNCFQPQGRLRLEISCHESPELNRDDPSVLTAQGVAERLVKILHYHEFPFVIGQMLFQNFTRDDVDEANIVTGNYEVETALGYEDAYFHPGENQTETPNE